MGAGGFRRDFRQALMHLASDFEGQTVASPPSRGNTAPFT